MSAIAVLRCDCCGAKSREVAAGDSPIGWFKRWELQSLGRTGPADRLADYCPACHESCAVAGRCVRPDRRAP